MMKLYRKSHESIPNIESPRRQQSNVSDLVEQELAVHELSQRQDRKRTLDFLPLKGEKPKMKVPEVLVENVSTVVFPQRLTRREKRFHEIHN